MPISNVQDTILRELYNEKAHMIGDYPGHPIGDDKLLTRTDVSEILGVCPRTAGYIMQRSGRAIKINNRRFILESSLLSYLEELEG